MGEARAGHTATLLRDGRVLVAGGAIDPDGDHVLASAEVYDPRSGSWVATGKMSVARSRHSATLLADGTVLVAAGIGTFVNPVDSRSLAAAELYDPRSGRWSTVPKLAAARFGHTSTLLRNGNVLVVGGSPGFGQLLASAELYDTGSRSWTAAARTIETRDAHTATLLTDGTVLVTGGHVGSVPLASAELYDPGVGSWLATARMITPRQDHTATLLSDGRVLVAGGPEGNAELYAAGSQP
jgi:N-acetylneuraminic acid mutarotase